MIKSNARVKKVGAYQSCMVSSPIHARCAHPYMATVLRNHLREKTKKHTHKTNNKQTNKNKTKQKKHRQHPQGIGQPRWNRLLCACLPACLPLVPFTGASPDNP
eukprot:COSAG05_NODE_106_length_18750_cov_677.083105_9_plen_104_part_00